MPYFDGTGKYGYPQTLRAQLDVVLPLANQLLESDDPQSLIRHGANQVTDLIGTAMILGGATGVVVGGVEIVTGAGAIPGLVSIGTGIASMAAGKALVDLL